MRGVIYARYSEGPRQTDQSIEGQVADCRTFAQQKGVDVIGIYADRHVSGKSVDGRDEFQRMMHDADRGLFDAVIVWKIDRFGRSREDIAVNKMRLRKAGVQLMYAREAVPDGPEGILMESLLEGLAEYYSADLRQKVVRGLRESAKKGRFVVGKLPHGYKKDADQHIIIDEPAADAIREVFRRHIAGAKTRELQEYLYRHGVTNRAGGMPSPSVVFRILRNERYLGRFSFDGIEIPAPAIIDQETFDRAALYFKTSRNNAEGKAKVDYYLTGKCICGLCGSKMTAETGTGKSGMKYHYYKCRTKGCELKPVPKDQLEELVLRHTMDDILREDATIEAIADRIMEIQEKRQADDPATMWKAKLKDARRRQKNLIEAIEAGAGASVVSRLSQVEADIEEYTIEIEKARLQRPVIPREMVVGWLKSFRTEDETIHKKILQTFVASVTVLPEEVIIAYNTKEKGPCSDTTLKVDPTERYSNTIEVIGSLILLHAKRAPAGGGIRREPARGSIAAIF